MGLADFIEQANAGQKVIPELPSTEALNPIKNIQEEEHSKTNKLVKIRFEEFSFLGPCPICQDRHFTYVEKRGFFCSTCQPGIAGIPAYATGQDRPKIKIIESTETQTPVQKVSAQIRGPKKETECFRIGFPWIIENLEELLVAGWTRPELFRRSRHRWFLGNWGLAWAGAWIKTGVEIGIEKNGRVTFKFKSGGRAITQAAYPLETCKKHEKTKLCQ